MIELHRMKRWFVVDEEGNKHYFFDGPAVADQERAPEGPEEAQRARVPPVVLELGAQMGRMNANEVATITMTTNVNDDNAPALENIP